jgi:hypothetical protein
MISKPSSTGLLTRDDDFSSGAGIPAGRCGQLGFPSRAATVSNLASAENPSARGDLQFRPCSQVVRPEELNTFSSLAVVFQHVQASFEHVQIL